MFGGNFAPAGWAFCQGGLLPISENETLFQLIGTTYGGDGQSTFGLPNLAARIPIHQGTGTSGITYTVGELAGTEQETLTTQQIPSHTHTMLASKDTGSLPDPGNHVVARTHTANVDMYLEDQPNVSMSAQAITPQGGSQPHQNTQPFLVVNFIISLFGIFPSPT
jgi:microcystin-dependent protein